MVDVLRGLQEAEPEAWAPTPQFKASSAGAEFAAYHARHPPAGRRDTPAPTDAVILNVTQPLPVRAGHVEVTEPDLSTLVERAMAYEAAAFARASRQAPTVVDDARSRRLAWRRRLMFASASAVIATVLGVLFVWRGSTRRLEGRLDVTSPAEPAPGSAIAKDTDALTVATSRPQAPATSPAPAALPAASARPTTSTAPSSTTAVASPLSPRAQPRPPIGDASFSARASAPSPPAPSDLASPASTSASRPSLVQEKFE